MVLTHATVADATRQVAQTAADGSKKRRGLVVLRFTPNDVSASEAMVKLTGDELGGRVIFGHR